MVSRWYSYCTRAWTEWRRITRSGETHLAVIVKNCLAQCRTAWIRAGIMVSVDISRSDGINTDEKMGWVYPESDSVELLSVLQSRAPE